MQLMSHTNIFISCISPVTHLGTRNKVQADVTTLIVLYIVHVCKI